MSEGFRPWVEGLVKTMEDDEAVIVYDDYPHLVAEYHLKNDYVVIESFSETVEIKFFDLERIMDAAREAHIRRNNERIKEGE